MKYYAVFGLFVVLLVGISCHKLLPKSPEVNELLDGPVEGLTTSENSRFLAGDRAFNDEVFTASTGLGPLFNAPSCGTCHAGDGKGHPFTTLIRFGQSDSTGNFFLSMGGPQLQNRAIPGFVPESVPQGAGFSRFLPPANAGLGFLEALSDDQILALADPLDSDGDGISGVPNYVFAPGFFTPQWYHIPKGARYIGRFGRKASAIDLLHQTVNAYNQDMGIVSTYSPVDTHTGLPGDPEVSDQTVQDVVFYLRTLKAPTSRNTGHEDYTAGKQLFNDLQCNKCHTPQWTTPQNPVAALSHKTFFPYTDMLLHDMGSGLDDGYSEGTAKTAEWRTPALWGLGLSANSQGGSYFLMHDGRAHSVEEAIQLHGGESAYSRALYQALTAQQKQQLLFFLQSL